VREQVGDGVRRDLGLSIELMDIDGFLWISEGPSHTGRPWDATDEGDLGRLPIVVMDDEVGDPSMILLKTIRAIGDAVTHSIAFSEIP
jgi:hypothetical protein